MKCAGLPQPSCAHNREGICATPWLAAMRSCIQSTRIMHVMKLHAAVQELMHLNVVKGIKDTFGAKTFMGRALVPIRPFADRPGEPITDWYDLGKGEWSNDDGTVSHLGLLVAYASQMIPARFAGQVSPGALVK